MSVTITMTHAGPMPSTPGAGAGVAADAVRLLADGIARRFGANEVLKGVGVTARARDVIAMISAPAASARARSCAA